MSMDKILSLVTVKTDVELLRDSDLLIQVDCPAPLAVIPPSIGAPAPLDKNIFSGTAGLGHQGREGTETQL